MNKVTSATTPTPSKIPTGTKVTLPELERLTILVEESAEVIQSVCKILRFGYESKNPFLEGAVTNREDLERELGDFENIVDMMVVAKDIRANKIAIQKALKAEMISYWLCMQEKKE